MGSQNQEIGVRGSIITLDVYFRAYNGGPLVDPDPAPTYTIKDPSGNIVFSSVGTRVAQAYG